VSFEKFLSAGQGRGFDKGDYVHVQLGPVFTILCTALSASVFTRFHSLQGNQERQNGYNNTTGNYQDADWTYWAKMQRVPLRLQ
jgi:hypothetical protein